jgi:tRNA(Ile2) C34 agmatinyltransferase TiaS
MADDLLLNETEAEPPLCKQCGEPMNLMRTIVAEGTEQLDYECPQCKYTEVQEREVAPPFMLPE